VPNTRHIAWDKRNSPIKNPFVLLEGRGHRTRRLVDQSEVSESGDDLTKIFVVRTGTVTVKVVAPGPTSAKNGKETREIPAGFRVSQDSPDRPISTAMSPCRPSKGTVAFSAYARLLDKFVAGDKNSREIFEIHGRLAMPDGVPHGPKQPPTLINLRIDRKFDLNLVDPKLSDATSRESAVYMPNAGKITSRGRDVTQEERKNSLFLSKLFDQAPQDFEIP
jgi:hypothetical protein